MAELYGDHENIDLQRITDNFILTIEMSILTQSSYMIHQFVQKSIGNFSISIF